MAQAQVDVTGLGTHKVVLEQHNYPVMSNQLDRLVIKDETLENTRTYTADQDLFVYTIKDGTQELKIEAQPDGTWLVNGEPASSPEAVAQLALKSPVLADASLHGLTLAYEVLNNVDKVPVEFLATETMAPICCVNCSGPNVSDLHGDPKPLLKAAIQLKRQQKKVGKKNSRG